MLNGLRSVLLAGAMTFTAICGAQAATVVEGTIPNSSTPIYTFFSFTGGALTIDTLGTGIYDPELFLFQDNGSPIAGLTGTLVGANDDGGIGPGGRQARLDFANLDAGSFVLAFGVYDFVESEARTNQDDGIAGSAGATYRLNFSSDVALQGTTPVPGPLAGAGTVPLLGFGVMAMRRRRQKLAA